MKTKLLIILLLSAFCMTGFSQEDPMNKIKRSKEDKAKDEQKLNAKGKGELQKAQAEFKKLKDATFEVAANEILNEDLENLVGLPKGEKPDTKLSDEIQQENKKNQNAIKEKLRKDSKNDKAEMDFSTEGAPPTGAAWTDAVYWYPAYYTPIKQQGGCGSCWAFAAVATFEHTYAKFFGTKLDLSEQDVLACGRTCANIDCGSCGGGWSDRALDFIKCRKIATEANYPYNPSQGNTCIAKPKSKGAYTWGRLTPNNTWPTVEWIKYYITLYGSVVTYMKAGISTFYSYGGGVYNGFPSSDPYNIDHAVTIVGWYEPWKAWIIKNSWGTGWGPYGGYAYVSYNACNIGKWVYWVYPLQ